MPISLFDSKTECCGCSACKSICPHKCISMIPDNEGFLYPEVDNDRCLDCKMCYNVCQIHNTLDPNGFSQQKFYSAQHYNDSVIMKSSSGGVFSALAELILEDGGVVYGCAYDEEMRAIHTHIDSLNDIRKLQGSKYVQSDLQNCYESVKRMLESGKYVLFTGTPCQIAGLKLYLGKKYERLLLVELICHGVPSPKLFKNYISYLQAKHKGKIINYEFRNKEKNGWGSEHRSFYLVAKGNNVKAYRPILPAYFSAFFYGINLRPSCYECKFANPNRNSDLTIGDYWGYWEKYKKNFPKGISVISANSQLGLEWITRLHGVMKIDEISFNEAVKGNENLLKPTRKPEMRKDFYTRLEGRRYSEINKVVYLDLRNIRKVLVSLYGRFIPMKTRFFFRKILGK